MVHRSPYPRRPVVRTLYLVGMTALTVVTGALALLVVLLVGIAGLAIFLELYING